MRKLFRMQYEPCSGQCYTDRDVLRFTKQNPEEVQELMDLLVQIHEPACGNANVRYAIDLDEELGIFTAVFFHYGKMEVFASKTLGGVIRLLAQHALFFYTTPAWWTEKLQGGVHGHDVCHHGKDQDLRVFMIKHSGLAPEVQQEMLARVA